MLESAVAFQYILCVPIQLSTTSRDSGLCNGDIFPHLLNLVVNHVDNIKVKAHDSEFLTRFSYDHMSTRDFRLCVIDS